MLYFYAVAAVTLCCLLTAPQSTAVSGHKPWRLVLGCVVVPAALVLSAAPTYVHTVNAPSDSYAGVAIGSNMWAALWCAAAGGALTLSVFALRLWGQRKTSTLTFGISINAGGIIASLYLLFCTVDQIQFSEDRADAGMVNLAMMKEMGLLPDVTCASGFALVRNTRAPVAQYRCPTDIVLGAYSDAPFAPWPGYEERTSATLAGDLRTLVWGDAPPLP